MPDVPIHSPDRGARSQAPPAPPTVASAYDRWSATYDVDHNRTRDLDARVVRAAELPIDGATVVELGCGTGKNTVWIAERARRIVALDLSAGMLARARSSVPSPNVAFVRCDVRDPWPVRDASVDLVVGNLVLEHVDSLAPVFAEATRVLRPGGTLFLCELHPFRQWQGGQAHFTDATSGETVHVTAHIHSVGDYVNGGLAAGLTLRAIGEWGDDDPPLGGEPAVPVLPRLLSVRFSR